MWFNIMKIKENMSKCPGEGNGINIVIEWTSQEKKRGGGLYTGPGPGLKDTCLLSSVSSVHGGM